jgi:hypothetical protein
MTAPADMAAEAGMTFDQAVATLQAVIKSWGYPASGILGGPGGRTLLKPNKLEMATLNTVAQELVEKQPDKHWSRADRKRGLVALGAFLMSLRAADDLMPTYLTFDLDELKSLVAVLTPLATLPES